MTTPNNTGAVTALRALPRWSDDREDMHPAPDGPWLRYDDVAAMLAASPPEDAPAVDGGDAVAWLRSEVLRIVHDINQSIEVCAALETPLTAEDHEATASDLRDIVQEFDERLAAAPAPAVGREALREGWESIREDAHEAASYHGNDPRVARRMERVAAWLDAHPPAEAPAPVGEAAFEDWLDTPISDCGHVVRHMLEGDPPLVAARAAWDEATARAALQSAAPVQGAVDVWGWHDGSATFITADEKARRLTQGDTFAKGYTIPFARITPPTGDPAHG